jgi:hypothetical protein
MNRQNRNNNSNNNNNNNNNNSNLHHTSNSSSVNYDVISAAPLLPVPPMPSSLTDPANFSMIPNLMDIFLLQKGQLQNSTTIDQKNLLSSESNTNPSQSSPPVQRFE